jgi:hypothetical protein
MALVIDKDSHLDHGLLPVHLEYIKERCSGEWADPDQNGVRIRTFSLDGQPLLQSGIYGPSAGDPPIEDSQIIMAIRMGRPWASRMIDKPARPTGLLTVVAGPSDDGTEPCVLYTAFGGPRAEKEVDDFSLSLWCDEHRGFLNVRRGLDLPMPGTCKACADRRAEVQRSVDFWSKHAISIYDCERVRNSDSVEVREWRSKASLFLSKRFPGNRLEFTCDRCSNNMECRYSFDSACVGTRCLRKILANEDR